MRRSGFSGASASSRNCLRLICDAAGHKLSRPVIPFGKFRIGKARASCDGAVEHEFGAKSSRRLARMLAEEISSASSSALRAPSSSSSSTARLISRHLDQRQELLEPVQGDVVLALRLARFAPLGLARLAIRVAGFSGAGRFIVGPGFLRRLPTAFRSARRPRRGLAGNLIAARAGTLALNAGWSRPPFSKCRMMPSPLACPAPAGPPRTRCEKLARNPVPDRRKARYLHEQRGCRRRRGAGSRDRARADHQHAAVGGVIKHEEPPRARNRACGSCRGRRKHRLFRAAGSRFPRAARRRSFPRRASFANRVPSRCCDVVSVTVAKRMAAIAARAHDETPAARLPLARTTRAASGWLASD